MMMAYRLHHAVLQGNRGNLQLEKFIFITDCNGARAHRMLPPHAQQFVMAWLFAVDSTGGTRTAMKEELATKHSSSMKISMMHRYLELSRHRLQQQKHQSADVLQQFNDGMQLLVDMGVVCVDSTANGGQWRDLNAAFRAGLQAALTG